MKTGTCPQCGAEFPVAIKRGTPQKFCSPAHRSLFNYHKNYRPVGPYHGFCLECGGPFTQDSTHGGSKQKFCNQNCRAKYGRKHRANRLQASLHLDTLVGLWSNKGSEGER